VEELRLDAPLAVVTKLAVHLPMLLVSKLEQEFTRLPHALGWTMIGVHRVVVAHVVHDSISP
jgi:hypothetical protein